MGAGLPAFRDRYAARRARPGSLKRIGASANKNRIPCNGDIRAFLQGGKGLGYGAGICIIPCRGDIIGRGAAIGYCQYTNGRKKPA